jgi:hypothetical protein
MPIRKLNNTWNRRILQTKSNLGLSLMKTMTLLMVRVFESLTMQLSRTASKVPGKAVRENVMQPMERGVPPHIRVCECYEHANRPILQTQIGRRYHLIADGSKVSSWHQLLFVSLAYRHRSIQIA